MRHHELEGTRRSARMDFGLWRRLARYAAAYPRDVALLCLLGFGVATGEVVLPLVIRDIVDAVAAGEGDLAGGALRYGLLILGLCTCVLSFIRIAGRLKTNVCHDIRRDGFRNLQELSFSFYDEHSVGWLMARMTSDSDRLANIMAWGTLDIVWGLTVTLGITVVSFLTDARLALFMLATVPVVVVLSLFFQRRILRSSRVVRKTNSRITAAYNEGLTGVRTSKAFCRDEPNLHEFRELTSTMLGASMRNALQSALYLPLIVALAGVTAALVLGAGGLDVVGGRISIGTLVAFLTYSRYLFDPIQEIARLLAELQMAQASAERILGLIEAEPAIQDGPEVLARMLDQQRNPVAGRAPDGGEPRIGRIEFEDVSFGYVAREPVLADFRLVIEPGETIALVGSTGGGKSTIASLLCRFYEPTAGRILVDGVDYTQRSLSWLQSNLGVVLQDPHLFRGTIAENIRYGKLDATDDEVRAAARTVGAEEFVLGLEQGYDTEVGESGSKLSTGEKQLVSFARAVLADPQVLVMDEATSSIDTETERKIQSGLERVLAGRTSLVIAHRLSTIRSADRILVIERGRIVEAGTHDELFRHGGRYHDLYTRQRVAESTLEGWSPGAA